MSQRPPATYWILVTATGSGGSSDAANFTLAASGESAVPGAIGATLHLQGIEFLADADGGSFIASPAMLPPGKTQPQNVTETIAAPSFAAQVPASINHATTAFPFKLCYGPLGVGAR